MNSKVKEKTGKKYSLKEAIIVAIVLLFLPLILLIAIIFGIVRVLIGKWLGFVVKNKWITKGVNTLFVYSNSPHWQEYIEKKIFPKISNKAIVLNWSERSQWVWKHKSLELKVFKHWSNVYSYKSMGLRGKKKWAGDQYNPIAIIFNPWWKPKVLQFWQPFRDYKHGNEKPLKDIEGELLKLIGNS